jgi:hypothetical protein
MNSEILENLKYRIEQMNCNVFTQEDVPNDTLITNIYDSSVVVICISSDITSNYKQAKVYDIAIRDNKKMIYLFVDPDYNYNTHPEIVSVFSPDNCIMFLDESYLDSTVCRIQSVLATSI